MFQFTVTLDITVGPYRVQTVLCDSSVTTIQPLLATQQVGAKQCKFTSPRSLCWMRRVDFAG